MTTKITGKIQHYSWGGFHFLPQLLNQKNNSLQPYAEYWLGAHPKAPSTLTLDGGETSELDKIIEEKSRSLLGKETTDHYGRLPYLFKILDVHQMLSIQVHPSKEEAEKGFLKENKAGIPLNAPNRNYKDDNHKPEMMVALSEFHLLHGFLEKQLLTERLKAIPELNIFLPLFSRKGFQALYNEVMKMPQEEVNDILGPLLKRILPLYKSNQLEKSNPAFWAARAVDSGMTSKDHIDRGIFSIYFFNLLHLQPGEGIFQAAGIPHAYLEGQNIELMANSDNVLRAGLTQKHIDVEELIKHTRFEGIKPNILRPNTNETNIDYPCPISDFYLQQIKLKKGETFSVSTYSLEIALLLSGETTVTNQKELTLKSGEAFMVSAGEKITLKAIEDTVIFKAGVPHH